MIVNSTFAQSALINIINIPICIVIAYYYYYYYECVFNNLKLYKIVNTYIVYNNWLAYY